MLQVILGGGRDNFFPNTTGAGKRRDGRHLADEWLTTARQHGETASYVDNKMALHNLVNSKNKVDNVLGKYSSFSLQIERKMLQLRLSTCRNCFCKCGASVLMTRERNCLGLLVPCFNTRGDT